MKSFSIFLGFSTILIYTITVIASVNHGTNWPLVAVNDLTALNWRSQFDTDFLVYLFLGATWISWREGGTAKGFVLGFFSVFLGGMFSFPYLLITTYQANGDLKKILLGVHATRDTEAETSG